MTGQLDEEELGLRFPATLIRVREFIKDEAEKWICIFRFAA